jgi:hypothetical protein
VHDHNWDTVRIATQLYIKAVPMGCGKKKFSIGFEFWIKLLHGDDSI